MTVLSAGPYPFGATVTLSATLTVKGVATDPTDITLTYKAPGQAGVTTVPKASLSHDATGVYSYAVAVSTPGEWHYRFVSTGTAAAAEETEFQVRRTEVV